jgi:hypothetical protein
MSTGRRLAETVHLAALGLWLGALVMSGAVAALVFPLVRDLDPTLPVFAAYEGPHWRLAAGRIAAQVFAVGEIIGLVCLLLAGVAFGVSAVLAGKARARVMAVRAAAMLLLIGAFGYQFFVLSPRMGSSLGAYWRAAAEGRTADALSHAEAFGRDHPTATSLMAATTFFALVALVVGAWSATGGGPVGDGGGGEIRPAKPRLEEPLLARTRGRA